MDTFVDVEERITEGEQPEGTVYSSFGSVAIGNGSNVFQNRSEWKLVGSIGMG